VGGGSHREVDWQGWLHRWETQQAGYLPEREDRFRTMLEVLEVLLPANFLAVDLAAGPGPLSQRLLAHFPDARCVAVDLDPVLLAIGRGALGSAGGRLRWVEADLREPEWPARIGETAVDAVVSTTALHWLRAENLVQVYRQLGELVRPGGVVLNGDHQQFSVHLPTFRRVAETLTERRSQAAMQASGAESWRAWWDAIRREPALADLVAERERRFGGEREGPSEPIFDLHVAALRDAGFREVGTIWQTLHNRILMAVR
jgi:trans-aconitate methyltransferase